MGDQTILCCDIELHKISAETDNCTRDGTLDKTGLKSAKINLDSPLNQN